MSRSNIISTDESHQSNAVRPIQAGPGNTIFASNTKQGNTNQARSSWHSDTNICRFVVRSSLGWKVAQRLVHPPRRLWMRTRIIKAADYRHQVEHRGRACVRIGFGQPSVTPQTIFDKPRIPIYASDHVPGQHVHNSTHREGHEHIGKVATYQCAILLAPRTNG